MKLIKRMSRKGLDFLHKQNLRRLHEAEGAILENVKLVLFDFDGVFTKNTVVVNQEGIEAVECSRLDGLGLSRLRVSGVFSEVVSTETNQVVAARCEKLGIAVSQGVKDKRESVISIAAAYGLDLKNVMFVGNDINDIPAFREVGYAVAVNDAYPAVFPWVHFITDRRGGEGCVREVCDFLSQVNGG